VRTDEFAPSAELQILEDLYDSEINISLGSFWDCGVWVKLGDPLNGYRAETTVRTISEAILWLRDQAIAHYPQSSFAQKYGHLLIQAPGPRLLPKR
jgi:hypothetical protein